MLSNYQLANIAEDLKINLPLKNIIMKDELKSAKIGNYIINLESSDVGNGTHWCCLVIEKNEAFWCDSFASPPPLEIIQACKKNKTIKRFWFNNWIIQDLDSQLCGWYSLGLLFYVKMNREKYESLKECCNHFINLFVDETKDNGGILKKYLRPYRFRNHSLLEHSN
jgi:hypothetical protein